MQVSRKKSTPHVFSRTPIAAGIVAALATPVVFAQSEDLAIEEIITTAQKREQSLQDVPISIQMLGSESIDELNLTNFKEYTQMLPSVVTQADDAQGGNTLVYMRGIATAGDGQATTSLPSVGMYLDELSITTIQGNIDVHMYDIARVEALAGPQGTLYGASSQAGTILVITNKPVFGESSSSFTAGVNTVDQGGTGFSLEGHVNIPVSDNAAIRLVGWHRDDAGWIDNVAATRVLRGNDDTDPTSSTYCGDPVDCSLDDVTLDNSAIAKKDYNTLETTGARAALRVDLNDNWTVDTTLMYQNAESRGSWGDDLSNILQSGDYAVSHFKDEFFDDEWAMIGLTIAGSIGNFDVVYAGSYLDRDVVGQQDYTDYSYWYDEIYATYAGYAGYYADVYFEDTGLRPYANQFEGVYGAGNIGTRVHTGAAYTNDDGYTKLNHELRISTDPENRVRGTLGVFVQKQFHDFEQLWETEDSVGSVMRMQFDGSKFDDTVYLNSMFRTDRDLAFFGSVSFDLTDDLEMTVGTRFFEPEVTVKGFFGFPGSMAQVWGTDGEDQCDADPSRVGTPQEQEWDSGATEDFNGQTDWKGKPCLNVDKRQDESDNVSRVNLTWSVSDENLLYFTWSEGYRPGGIQRRPTLGTYLSDFLTSTEIGWKSRWLDNRLQWNGAVFTQDWDDIQIALTGENAITLVANGPSASVDGLEMDMLWLATDNLRLSAAVAIYDSQLEDDYCCQSDDVTPLAPKGTRLPLTADFKGNLVARYHFDMGGFDSYVQGAMVYQSDRDVDLDQAANDILGVLPSYTTLDLAAGIARDNWALDLFVSNATGADEPLLHTAQCVAETCGAQVYGIRIKPRTIGLQYRMDF